MLIDERSIRIELDAQLSAERARAVAARLNDRLAEFAAVLAIELTELVGVVVRVEVD